MPIGKVNYGVFGSSPATAGDSELPEADRYGNNQNDARSYKLNGGYSSNETKNDGSGGAPETLIEREIREQRERELELASLRNSLTLQRSLTSEVHNEPPQHLKEETLASNGVVTWGAQDVPAVENGYAEFSGASTNQLTDEELPPARNNSSYNNPGENLIIRELLEQQQREEELRQHWREMGFQLITYEDDTDQVYDVPDDSRQATKVVEQIAPTANRKEAVSSFSAGSLSTAATEAKLTVRREPEVKAAELPPPLPLTPPPDKNRRRDLAVDVRASVGGRDAFDHLQQQPETPMRSSKIVLPLPDDEGDKRDNDNLVAVATPLYMPTNETLMQRELRAAREREEAVRRLRGYLINFDDEEQRRSREVAVEIEVKVKSDRPIRRSKSEAIDRTAPRKVSDVIDGRQQPSAGVGDDDEKADHQFAKRFAESRLKAELQQQRQRELDLRRSGLIHTISDERVGEPTKFVEVVNDSSGTTTTIAAATTSSFTAAGKQSGGAVLEAKTVDASVAAVAFETKTEVPQPVTTSQRVEKVATVKDTRVPAASASTTVVTPRRELPAVLRTYSYPVVSQGDDVDSSHASNFNKLSPEARIEAEVAEFKRREAELRTIREALRQLSDDRPALTSSVNVDSRASEVESAEIQPSHDLQWDHLPIIQQQQQFENHQDEAPSGGDRIRRRLALIDEWEKICVSN